HAREGWFQIYCLGGNWLKICECCPSTMKELWLRLQSYLAEMPAAKRCLSTKRRRPPVILLVWSKSSLQSFLSSPLSVAVKTKLRQRQGKHSGIARSAMVL
ncbi:unnamed protein product, partial [Ectocarpus fasciculatus]